MARVWCVHEHIIIIEDPTETVSWLYHLLGSFYLYHVLQGRQYRVYWRSGDLMAVSYPEQYVCAVERYINWPTPLVFLLCNRLERRRYMCTRSSQERNSGVLGHLRYHNSSPVQIYSRFGVFIVHTVLVYLWWLVHNYLHSIYTRLNNVWGSSDSMAGWVETLEEVWRRP